MVTPARLKIKPEAAPAQRTKKDFGDKATNYYYNGGNIIMETDKDQKVTARNIRGLRLIYSETNPGQINSQYLYYLHNAHGDVNQLLNEQGQVIKDYRYDTFGEEEMPEKQAFGGNQATELWRQEVEKIDNPFRYCGEYLDEETGNYYLRARYYDTSMQRFINEGSYGVFRGSKWPEHLYNYVGNNPIGRIDPSGHGIISNIAGAVGSFFGGPVGSVIAAVGSTFDNALGHRSGGGGSKSSHNEVTTASIGDNKMVITAGPDEVQKAGISSAQQRVNNILGIFHRYDGFRGAYHIGDYSYGETFTDIYKEAKNRFNNKQSWKKAIDNIIGVITARTGVWWANIIAGLTNSNSTPGLSDLPVDKTSVEKAKATMEYVNNSQYKYLIHDSTARKEFLEELSNLEKDILAFPDNPYKDPLSNQKYQQAQIDYVRGIINMNKNFDQSKEDMFYLISFI